MLGRVVEHKRRKGAQARNPADTHGAAFESMFTPGSIVGAMQSDSEPQHEWQICEPLFATDP